MPSLSKLTVKQIKQSKPFGVKTSSPVHDMKLHCIPAQCGFEERIIKGKKHRGNYFIERTKKNRHGSRIASRRLLAEKNTC